MYCQKTQTINFSVDAGSDYTSSDNLLNRDDHEGHTLLNDKVSLELKRPVGKLGVFAAKVEGETALLKITGLTMLASGTRNRNYLMEHDVEFLKDNVEQGVAGAEKLSVVSDNVEKTLAENATAEERKNPANYTAVLAAPFYPFENPWGTTTTDVDSWETPGDAQGNVLQIDYEFDGEANSKLVYLPPIERNHYYAICCLIHNFGEITVEYVVDNWQDGGTYELEFEYPTYSNPITPWGSSGPLEGEAQYDQPEVYYNEDPNSEEGCYSFSFTIEKPEGQEWRPTLLNATGEDYEVTVLQGGQVVVPSEEAGCYRPSENPYQIKIRPLQDVERELHLGIAYTPKWDPDGSSLLLINGRTDNFAWKGTTLAEVIVIKQVVKSTE